MSDSRGFRTDVLELLRPLSLSVLRWPGATSSATTYGPTASGPPAPGRSGSSWPGVLSSPTGSGRTSSCSIAPNWAPRPTSASTWVRGTSPRLSPGSSTATRPPAATGPTVAARTATRPLTVSPMGSGQRDVRGLAGGPDVGGRVRKGGGEMGQGHPSPGPCRQTGELRPQRLGRVGPRRHRSDGIPGRPALAAHLHRCEDYEQYVVSKKGEDAKPATTSSPDTTSTVELPASSIRSSSTSDSPSPTSIPPT